MGHLVKYYENQLPSEKSGKLLSKKYESNSTNEGNDEMYSGTDRESDSSEVADSGEVAKYTWGMPLESYCLGTNK